MRLNKAWLAILPIIGGLISRFHGGGFVGGFNKSIKNLLWAIPFGVIPYLAGTHLIVSTLSVLLCLIGKASGHGRGLGLNGPMKEGAKPEKIEIIIRWLEPSLTTHAYKHLILACSGAFAVSGAVVAFSTLSLSAGIVVLFGGILKGLAYEIGYKIYPQGTGRGIKHFNEATQIGELLAGFFAYGGLVIAYAIS